MSVIASHRHLASPDTAYGFVDVGKRARVSPPTSPDSSSQSFWDTQAWARFKLWAGVKDFTFSQDALGHMLVKPTTIGTNLDLEHLEELPWVGFESTAGSNQDQESWPAWCPWALSGKNKGCSS